jgi:phosphocarrier protein
MIEKTFQVRNRLGLHARPAALFVQTAGKYQANVRVFKDDLEVNGKSVMGLMMLAAECGCRLRILVDGSDEAQALDALDRLFQRKFEED